MKKYIVSSNGMEITEEALKEIYNLHSFVTFNERDYNAWKQSRIEQGVIKIK